MITKNELVAALRRGSSCQTWLGNLSFNTATNFLMDFRNLQKFVAADFYRRPLRGQTPVAGSISVFFGWAAIDLKGRHYFVVGAFQKKENKAVKSSRRQAAIIQVWFHGTGPVR
jgi:hypothetical protein